MSRSMRIIVIVMFFAGVAGAGVAGAMAYVRTAPATINFVAGHKAGTPVHMSIETVGQMGVAPGHIHPAWVSYLTRAPDGKWVHTTQWNLPPHTRIDVTEYEYDTGSPLRNQYWGQIQGTVGGTATYFLNGHLGRGHTVSTVNTYNGNGVAHTFSVPELGISVPFYGVAGDAPNQCSVAPCTTRFAHNVIKFSFMTPGVGQYRWQCFIPCAAGYFDGNGGPMDTLGYMGGFIKVIPQ